MEEHQLEQSFHSYFQSYKTEIIEAIQAASSWPEVYQAMGQHELKLKPRDNGLV